MAPMHDATVQVGRKRKKERHSKRKRVWCPTKVFQQFLLWRREFKKDKACVGKRHAFLFYDSYRARNFIGFFLAFSKYILRETITYGKSCLESGLKRGVQWSYGESIRTFIVRDIGGSYETFRTFAINVEILWRGVVRLDV